MNKPMDWMQRAFDLALLGAGKVAPNPLVGCVIIKNNEIIGEGWHKSYGGPHAEVEAIRSITETYSAEGSTAFVTLEPCAHFGKTPPCADLLIQQKIKKVYISNLDPNVLVAGKGVQKLRDAGIEVEIGLLKELGERLNEHFFTFHRKRRPFITVKFASSKDQFIAKKDGQTFVFSNELSKKMVHKLRAEHQAILVGVNTANADNPQLNTRYWPGKSPIRLIIDPNNRVNKNLHLVTDDQASIFFTKNYSFELGSKKWIALGDINEEEFAQHVINKCFELGIQSILLEGGSKTIEHLIKAKLVDQIYHIESDINLLEGIKAPDLRFQYTSEKQIGKNNKWKFIRI
jgi:diaminohydroxyphosphoribosylaminopyrimidine deaminase/5-amino-6-(5-phosphoribosylamino)uracil reductase